jgi:hypothetical protein
MPPIDEDSTLVYILLKPYGYCKRWFTTYDVAIIGLCKTKIKLGWCTHVWDNCY